MDKSTKYGLIFGGGFLTGGLLFSSLIGVSLLKSKRVKKAISQGIADKICNLIYPEKLVTDSFNKQMEVKLSSLSNQWTSIPLFETQLAGETFLEKVEQDIEIYGSASIARLYELADISIDATPNLECHGWTSLEGFKLIRTANGYAICAPTPQVISDDDDD